MDAIKNIYYTNKREAKQRMVETFDNILSKYYDGDLSRRKTIVTKNSDNLYYLNSDTKFNGLYRYLDKNTVKLSIVHKATGATESLHFIIKFIKTQII